MYCITCGIRLPDDASFCSSCGRATYRPDSVETPATADSPAAAETPVLIGTFAHLDSAGGRSMARNWSEAFDLPYFHEGRWWARGPSGEVLVWEDQRQHWDLALLTQTPFFMRRPRFRSLRTPATWIYVMMAFFALFCVLAIASDAEQVYIGSEIDGGREFSEAELDSASSVAGAMRGLQVLAIFAAAPLLVWWAYRGTKNLAAIGTETLDIRPAWSIAWWFIPVANFVQPARVLNQLWKASHPDLPLRPTDDWRHRSEDFLTVAWWPACVALYFAWNVVLYQWDSRDLDDPARGAWAAGLIAADVLLMALALVGIAVVARLTRRLHFANARFDAPVILPPSAMPTPAEAST